MITLLKTFFGKIALYAIFFYFCGVIKNQTDMEKHLTEEQESRIREIESWHEKELAKINERREYRMKNYYDCVDDYSYGGACDRADDAAERTIDLSRDLRIEEIKEGVIRREISHLELVDLDGNTVSDCPFTGRFGHSFPVDGGYVGIPKKMSTLEKKGYRMVKRTVSFELRFGGFLSNGRVKWKSISRTGETSEESCAYDCGEQARYDNMVYQEAFLKSKTPE